jgi:hypothetical protein
MPTIYRRCSVAGHAVYVDGRPDGGIRAAWGQCHRGNSGRQSPSRESSGSARESAGSTLKSSARNVRSRLHPGQDGTTPSCCECRGQGILAAPGYNEGPPMGDRRAFATKRYNALV